MQYRTIPGLDAETSLLGFGCMRLPVDSSGQIDEAAATAMIDHAIANGVNYFDTAYGYHNEQSESFVGRALCSRHPRESFYLADKLPVWKTPDVESAEEVFQEQLARMQTDYVDFHLLHALSKDRWEELKVNGVLDWQRQKKEEGIVHRIGFSFHDKPEVLKEILEYQHWDFCQLQINYLDWEQYQSKEMYELCLEHNVPVVVMEPIRGGSLANPHEDVISLFKSVAPDYSPAAVALRFVASLDKVTTVLSGMSEAVQVTENLETLGNFTGISPAEDEMYEQARAIFRTLPLIPCTSCQYCSICPQQIEMWELFTRYNNHISYNNIGSLVKYVREHDIEHLPPACIECYQCEEQCPQNIEIVKLIQEVYSLAKTNGA